MKKFAFMVLIGTATGLASNPAQAQVVPATTDPTYLAVTSTSGVGGVCANPYCVNPQQGIPLSYFASTAGVSGQINGTTSQISGLSSQISSLSNQIDTLNGQFTKAYEGVAISAAMGDAIPNPGDRFAVRLNTAEFSSQAAGAISFSYNFADNARISVNYGQARSQTIVSGGLTFSFR